MKILDARKEQFTEEELVEIFIYVKQKLLLKSQMNGYQIITPLYNETDQNTRLYKIRFYLENQCYYIQVTGTLKINEKPKLFIIDYISIEPIMEVNCSG